MITNKKGKLFAVIFTTVCMFVAMLGGFVGLFEAVDTSTPVIANAATSSDYYAPLDDDLNKTGTAFRSELASLITDTHTYLTTYAGLMSVWDDSDVNSEGKLIQFYTGYLVSVPSNYNSGTNREHVWPKNAGNAFDGDAERRVGSDAHHLRPANTNLNSSRSDKNFDEVPTTNANLVTQSSGSNPCYATSTFFYPGVGYRGATARILMYVQTRWGDEYNLRFVLGDGGNKLMGDIETLMKWHIEEPPTEEEIKRNDEIAKVQGNRNPFIDHPEYAEMIYCHDGQAYNDELQAVVKQYGSYLDNLTDETLEVESINLSTTSATLTTGETLSIGASVTPSNAVSTVTWTSSNPNVATVNETTGVVTALSAGTTTITATSTKTPSVKATATISVKSISAITITGTPAKTTYNAGDAFNPTGLTVKATYSDTTTVTIPNSSVQWLDGTTRQTTLSTGTTSIIAKYGNIEKTITGIEVKAVTTKTLTITRSNFSGSGAYSWNSWTSDGISGYGFMYPGNSGQIQMNTGKTAQYIYNTTPLTGGIVSITIKGTDGKKYEVRTSSTAFAQGNGTATGGTGRGDISLSASGGTLKIDTNDEYFALNYASSGAVYIDEIIIVYGGDDSACSHIPSDWIVDTPATCGAVGRQHKECTKCGEVLDAEEIPQNSNHTWGDWSTTTEPECNKFGEQTRQCSACLTTETKQIEKTQHTWGDWSTTTEPECDKFGEETRECSICHETETNQLPKEQHTWGNWIDNGNGTETRECSECDETEARECANLSKIEEFETAVNSIASATDMEAKFNAISTALSKYNNLTDAEKDAATETYALLENQISEYNSLVGTLNVQSKQATSDAIKFFASSFSVLAFIAYLISKMI